MHDVTNKAVISPQLTKTGLFVVQNLKKRSTHHNVVPLVQFDGQISVRLDPLGIGRVHDCLRGGPDGDGLGQLSFSGSGDPGHFRREICDVVFFLLQGGLGHEDGEVAVLHAQLLDLTVEEGLFKN